MKKLIQFLFFIRPDGENLPAQQRANLLVLYAIAVSTLLAMPFNLASDLASGDLFAPLFDLFFLIMVLAGMTVFFVTRQVRKARYFMIAGIFGMVGYLILTAGGLRGFGFLYFIAGFSLLYFVMGLRGGILFAGFYLVGIFVRLTFFPVESSLSLYVDADQRFRFILVFLVATILGVVGVIYQEYLVNYLAKIAYRDPITGLPNRNRLTEILQLGLASKKPFHLIAVKVFNLGRISGHHGMGVTDQLLSELGRRISLRVLQGTLTGRWSGALFLIRPEKADLPDLQRITREILTSTAEPYQHEGGEILLQTGVAVTRFPEDGATLDRLLANLTTTLSQSDDRIGRVTFFNEKDWEDEQRRFVLANAMKGAVSRGEFHLVYHPKINMKSGKILGAEVLMRWTSKELGPISPGEFIPVAEAAGNISEITDFLLKRFMADHQRILAETPAGHPGLSHAVNLSPIDLGNSGLPAKIISLCKNFNLDPQLIELEITEGTMMSNDPAVMTVLKELREHGFSLAIDDFGTGYSSLSYLHRIEAGNLKVDQSFVRQIAPGSVILPIIDAIISMGHSLGLVITAEGIETMAQADYLRQKGCDFGQGWLYSKPLPLETYLEFIKTKA